MPTNSKDSQVRVAVLGAGAVGSYFGGMLARSGVPVTLIGRAAHVEAMRTGGLFLDSVSFQEHIPMGASVEPSAARDADVVLFCVKTTDTEEAARSLAPHIAKGAIVVSLQNGVDNIERIRAASGIEALPAVVYVAAALPEPGHVKHFGRGELVVGELKGGVPSTSLSDRAERVASLFTAAKVPCRVSPDISVDLWTKFIMNCAGNAVTAITQTSYAAAARNLQTREVMSQVIAETVVVARASDVALPQVDFIAMGLKFIESIGSATSSTAQDIARGKRTEIDSLNGYVARRGKELGISTPASFALFALVKLLEDKAAEQQRAASQKSSA
ncbi:MAG TPA: 2-dehydropantoate 2-reductase [Candidatus Acidoferrales bacterium]|nr:2-dehydropantoate 2-reductase [Candidatus Acidoferrales bacterium]